MIKTPCKLWCENARPGKYGAVKYKGSVWRAHRAAWDRERGPIPQGLFVCHKCDNPPCVRIDHLFIGTAAENMADKIAKGRFRIAPPTPVHDYKKSRSISVSKIPARISRTKYSPLRAIVAKLPSGRMVEWPDPPANPFATIRGWEKMIGFRPDIKTRNGTVWIGRP